MIEANRIFEVFDSGLRQSWIRARSYANGSETVSCSLSSQGPKSLAVSVTFQKNTRSIYITQKSETRKLPQLATEKFKCPSSLAAACTSRLDFPTREAAEKDVLDVLWRCWARGATGAGALVRLLLELGGCTCRALLGERLPCCNALSAPPEMSGRGRWERCQQFAHDRCTISNARVLIWPYGHSSGATRAFTEDLATLSVVIGKRFVSILLRRLSRPGFDDSTMALPVKTDRQYADVLIVKKKA
ncbi:hypothetical protein C8R47DRAFT_1248507 [Mycena vitilis]|nr:hypothetical protein C8R47DRAFT_1248507 [Mycena vitilis]